MVFLHRIVVGPLQTNCYLYGSKISKEIGIIDPGGSPQKIIAKIKEQQLNPQMILITHEHSDHIAGVPKVAAEFKTPIYASNEVKSRRFKVDQQLQQGDSVKIGPIQLTVLAAPGHSPGGLFLVDYENQNVFVGDTIFARSIGRTDFQGGNQAKLFRSIKTKLVNNLKINPSCTLWPGHGPQTTIRKEISQNPFRSQFS